MKIINYIFDSRWRKVSDEEFEKFEGKKIKAPNTFKLFLLQSMLQAF